MRDYIEKRTVEIAEYIVKTNSTVRGAAQTFGISKSTVHKDLTTRLRCIRPDLYGKVRHLLEINKAERHIRGGNATKNMYAAKREGRDRCDRRDGREGRDVCDRHEVRKEA